MKKPEMPPIPVPSGLSERSVALWSSLVPRRARSIERLTLLEEGLRALDMAAEIETKLKIEGPVSGIHVSPLVKIHRDSKLLFLKIWTKLGLSHDVSDFG